MDETSAVCNATRQRSSRLLVGSVGKCNNETESLVLNGISYVQCVTLMLTVLLSRIAMMSNAEIRQVHHNHSGDERKR